MVRFARSWFTADETQLTPECLAILNPPEIFLLYDPLVAEDMPPNLITVEFHNGLWIYLTRFEYLNWVWLFRSLFRSLSKLNLATWSQGMWPEVGLEMAEEFLDKWFVIETEASVK